MQPNDLQRQNDTPVQPVNAPQQPTEYGTPVDVQSYESSDIESLPDSDERLTPDQATPSQLPVVEPVQWQAAEYLQHSKTPIWYVGFVTVVAILIAAAVILMQAWTFVVLILVMAVALMVYSHRPPRQITYVLSAKGIYINDQLHPLGEFKAFGVIQEPDHNTLVLIPVKRFRPGLSVFFPSEVGEQIVDLVGGYLPMKEQKPDLFDKIVHKLRI